MSPELSPLVGIAIAAVFISVMTEWRVYAQCKIAREVWEPHYQEEIAELKERLEYAEARWAEWTRIAVDQTVGYSERRSVWGHRN